jgi:hypothetical protein
MSKRNLRSEVIRFRKQGKTYSEIQKKLKSIIPKSTLSYWCRNISLPRGYKRKIGEYNKFNLIKARKIALVVNKIKRGKYLQAVLNRNLHLETALKNRDTAKIALAMLYLGEGSKDSKRGSLMFGNSDPFIVSLFLRLLRCCYNINEGKFRCTLQCRADQNIKKLERFWFRITGIPLSQFYRARVDPRTIGKKSNKLDYKGVCRIDYFSAELFIELKQIAEIVNKGI